MFGPGDATRAGCVTTLRFDVAAVAWRFDQDIEFSPPFRTGFRHPSTGRSAAGPRRRLR